jgi:MYXO-CTERM domain-containing protein
MRAAQLASISSVALIVAASPGGAMAVGISNTLIRASGNAELAGVPPANFLTSSQPIAAGSLARVKNVNVLGTNVTVDAAVSARSTTSYVTAVLARSNGQNPASPPAALSQASIDQRITNDTANRVRVDYTFRIDAGSAGYYSPQGATPTFEFTARPDGQVDLFSSLSVNSATIWSGGLTGVFPTVCSPPTCSNYATYSQTGALTALSVTTDVSGGASWSERLFTVTLGELDPNEFLDFSYLLRSSASVANAWCGTVGGGSMGCVGLRINAGDPGAVGTSNGLGIVFTSLGGSSSGPTQASEPSTLLLAAAGLAGLGLARRVRRKKG